MKIENIKQKLIRVLNQLEFIRQQYLKYGLAIADEAKTTFEHEGRFGLRSWARRNNIVQPRKKISR